MHYKAGICLHHGKTKIWNSQGEKPECVDFLEKEAHQLQPEAVFWRGNPELPVSKQGLSYILAQLEQKAEEHKVFLRRIPVIQDVQSAWLLLLYDAAPRANYWLRTANQNLRLLLQNATTRTSGHVSVTFWRSMERGPLSSVHRCRCPWVEWDWGPLAEFVKPPTGRVGPTAWRW